ncbi:condensation domain-containing protein [Actinokineospora guangxiensis]|uniref:Condensation domain-containing protein n=1 Tax=Actinokineospora guangxiensis TaxID=1490288 RepID=A0ABW0EJY4_9PSEU
MAAHRTAPLTWGQRNIWLDHQQLPPSARHELNFSVDYTPPEGSTAQNLRRALDALVRRYESLRSTYGWVPGQGAVQRVEPPGPVPVLVHETTEHPGVPASEVLAKAGSEPFDLDARGPIRATVITTDGVPTLMVFVGHHIAVDDWSLERMRAEYAELHGDLLARRPVRLSPVRHHPVDLAAYEASPAGRAAADRAADYWSRTLAEAPSDLWSARRVPAGGPAHSVTASSTAVLAAARELASRHQVWPSLVHTAAFTAVAAACTGAAGVPFLAYASNRDLPLHADLMSCLFLPVVVHTDCSDTPAFDEIVRRTAKSCGEAMDHSHAEYDRVLELTALESAGRATPLRLATAVNYLQYPDKTRGGTRSTLTHNAAPTGWAALEDDFYLRIGEWSDCTVTTLYASGDIMTPETAERFLRAMESLLVTAAATDAPLPLSEIADMAAFPPPPLSPAVAPPPPDPPDLQAVSALATAVASANNLADVDLAQPYVTTGGRILAIPHVRALLADTGWTAPSLRTFTTPAPLSSLAALLTRT